MKKNCFFFFYLFVIAQNTSAYELPIVNLINSSGTTDIPEVSSDGITVAGGNGVGNSASQLSQPNSVFVDGTGNIYVTDRQNNRVQKWVPGAVAGVTVAGGNGAGPAAIGFCSAVSVFVDASGNIYALDKYGYSVRKKASGSSTITTVAGGNGYGSASNQFNLPTGLFVDAAGNIYVSDGFNQRIQKWSPGASEGVTVAGRHGAGSAANQLDNPIGIFVDPSGNIFVADANNNRVQQFSGAVASESSIKGITVASAFAYGSTDAVFVDATGNIYFHNSIYSVFYKRAQGSAAGGPIISGQSGSRGLAVDALGNVYFADVVSGSIQKWAPGATTGVTVAGGNGGGSAANQLSTPNGLFIDPAGNMYVSDAGNYRIQKWAPGATSGVTVAGGNGSGPAANQVSPLGVSVDAAGNIYISDGVNYRVQKWTPGATSGTTVAGGHGRGSAANQFNNQKDLTVDALGNVYIVDQDNDRIQKWAPGAIAGVTVAGGNGRGSATDQLWAPTDVCLDAAGNLYVADAGGNDRIQKFEVRGLNFKYYEGTYAALPDFNNLAPVKTGTSSNVDISLRTPGRDDNFAFIWQGYINIPTPGTYIFETNSDDGSRLYFNNQYAAGITPTVDNDGIHAAKPATATVTVPAAGSYPISITYFEKDGGESMQVYWTGPGISRQQIPDAAFTLTEAGDHTPPSVPTNFRIISKGSTNFSFAWDNSTDNVGVTGYDIYLKGQMVTLNQTHIDATLLLPNTSYSYTVRARDFAGNTSAFSEPFVITTASGETGLAYKYFEGTWNTLPDFTTLAPTLIGNSANVDISLRPAGRNDNFGFVWQGYINIPTPGNYTFETVSDDGSKLYFNPSTPLPATATVTNDGLHAATSATGTIYIANAGSYPIYISYFEKDGGESMQVFWTGPGFEREAIPNSAFTVQKLDPHISYSYYEGTWEALPDFTNLTSVAFGYTANMDINVRPQNRNDNFAITWSGRINIPLAGTYTFETVSDDGSKLYFNTYDFSGVPLVNNDGLHAPKSASGSVYVPNPGAYNFAISYFEKDGGENMQVFWSGPGFTRQLIPNVAFSYIPLDSNAPAPVTLRALYAGRGFVNLDWNNSTDDVGVAAYDVYVDGVKKYTCTESAITADNLAPNTTYTFTVVARDMAGNVSSSSNAVTTKTELFASGLKYRYYEGTWTTLPNFNNLTPVKTGSTANTDINERNIGVNDNFAFVWEGYIKIPVAGNYTFETISDDGSRFYFNSVYVPGNTALVNNDGIHAAVSALGTINIPAAGIYPISVTFFENNGGETMQLFWSGPGIGRRPIPNTAFVEPAPVMTAAAYGNGSTIGAISDLDKNKTVISKVYPDPFVDNFSIEFNNTSSKNDISINMRDMNGRLVYSYHAGKLAEGKNTLAISLKNAHLSKGIYIVSLNVNGIKSKTVSLLKR